MQLFSSNVLVQLDSQLAEFSLVFNDSGWNVFRADTINHSKF
jgi:hypothetical protein